jgi:hypothetical protein
MKPENQIESLLELTQQAYQEYLNKFFESQLQMFVRHILSEIDCGKTYVMIDFDDLNKTNRERMIEHFQNEGLKVEKEHNMANRYKISGWTEDKT